MVPLIRGMPMSLTDHVDRNPKVKLLRGRIGYVKTWIEEDDEDIIYHGPYFYGQLFTDSA